MAVNKKQQRKLFGDVVENLFLLENTYDKMRYTLLKAWDIFFERVPTFKKMDAKTQFYICEAACLISMGASSNGIRNARILTNPPPSETEINFYLEFGFEKPTQIELNTKLMII